MYSENKDADQLCSYCTADLRLCFCLCLFSCVAAQILQYVIIQIVIKSSSFGVNKTVNNLLLTTF